MKKKILTGLMILVPIILILVVVLCRVMIKPSNESIIEGLKQENCYKADVDYIFTNARGDEIENTTVYFQKDKGTKIDFGQDKSKIYKDDKIIVHDNIHNSEYGMDESLSDLHEIALLNNILSYPISSEGIKEGQEEWGERIYLYFTVEVFENNNHIDTAKVFIDKKEKTPIAIIVYDKDGKASMKIIYKNYQVLKQLDEDLL